MQVIPVVDVRGGEVVAAHRGDRARYRPLATPLAPTAHPAAVARGLAGLFPFPTLYVADLDGIERGAPDRATQEALAAAWPGAELWIDDGTAASPSPGADPPVSRHRGEAKKPAVPSPLPGGERPLPRPRPGEAGEGAAPQPLIESELLPQTTKSHVLGSESLSSLKDYHRARERAGPHAPLSLDFRGDAFIGPPELLADAGFWPHRVIVMTLQRVGSGEGPDVARLAGIIARAGGRAVYAAGGVRHADDLRALRDLGAAGALVATALHAGRIARRDLERLAAS